MVKLYGKRLAPAVLALFFVALLCVPALAAGGSCELTADKTEWIEIDPAKDVTITANGPAGENLFYVKGYRKMVEEWVSYGRIPPDRAWKKTFPSGMDMLYFYCHKGTVKIDVTQ